MKGRSNWAKPRSFIILPIFLTICCLFFSCMAGNPAEEGQSPGSPSDLGMKLGSIHLKWTDNSGNELGFIIERKIKAEGAWKEIGRVGANVTEYVDNYYLMEDVPAFYRVCAYNNQGNSAYSNITFVHSMLWSGFRDVKVSGKYAYCSNSNGLVIIDVSDPADPKKVSTLALGAKGSAGTWLTVQKILVGPGPYVYIPFGQAGIKIINVSDPANPVLVATFPTIGYAESIFMESSGAKTHAYISEYAFTEDQFMGLEIADFTDILNPTPVTSIPFDFIGYSFVRSPYAYVVDGYGFTVIDVSNLPNAPTVAWYDEWAWLDLYTYYDITVKGDYAYVSYFQEDQYGLDAVDISDPLTPTYLSYWETTGNYGVPTVLLDNEVDIAYLTSTDIQLIDISDPYNIHDNFGSWYIDMSTGANNIARVGDNIFIAEEQGLEIYTITFSGPPLDLDVFEYLGAYYTNDYVTDLEIQDRPDLAKKFIYVATSYTGLKVADITDETSPIIVYPTDDPDPDDPPTELEHLLVRGNFLYAISSWEVNIFDVLNPAAPVLLSTYPIDRFWNWPEWDLEGAAISDDYMFICQSLIDNLVEVVDVSDPSAPFHASDYLAPSEPLTIAVDGDYGFIGESEGLEIVDVSDVNNITRASLTADTSVSEILVSGNLAYYANLTSFVVMDIANKFGPTTLGSYVLPENYGVPFRFMKDGNKVYVTTLADEIVMLDVSDPSNIRETGDFPTPGIPLFLAVDNGVFYIADEYSLLMIK